MSRCRREVGPILHSLPLRSSLNFWARYGFTNVITPADLITAYPALWPFANRQLYTSHARPLPLPISSEAMLRGLTLEKNLRVAAILVFHDPRDWALDIQIVLDLLLSHKGFLGTLSRLHGDQSLDNCGFQQDGQPMLCFSNPDMLWASEYHLDRLGQGGFKRALMGVWSGVTGGEKKGVHLRHRTFGKPTRRTYEFAEQKLNAHRKTLLNSHKESETSLEKVYMVGGMLASIAGRFFVLSLIISDNPASDIRGANEYRSPWGTLWDSILVQTGVYRSGAPEHPPTNIVPDITAAVQWALKSSGWQEPFP